MKYYHVIYNSSQKNQGGSPGFGVRTSTIGTPIEYIRAVEQEGCFGYESGSIKQPTAKDLLENGDRILGMPKSFRLAKILIPTTGKKIFAYMRTVCVGFDYPYYVKFTAARMDNFVTDVYIFEDYPGIDIAQIFYDDPEDGCNGFKPKCATPSPTNEEMKALSLGAADPLPVEEKPFTTKSLQGVDIRVVELLLSYFEALYTKKPVLVKCKQEEAANLMADLIRVIPSEIEQDATFITNYQMLGVKDGYRFFFINEGYEYDYKSTSQFVTLDLTTNQSVKTTEAELYRDRITECLLNKDKNNLDKISSWLLSPVYKSVRKNSPEIKSVLFKYIYESESFSINDFFVNQDELWPILIDLFKTDPKQQELLNTHLKDSLSKEEDSENKASLIKVVNKMAECGFNLDDVIISEKKNVSRLILDTPEYFDEILTKVGGIKGITRFIEKSAFVDNNDYLDNPVLVKWWTSVFPYFYTEGDLKKETVISRMFSIGISNDDIEKVITYFNLSLTVSTQVLLDVIKASPTCAEKAWPIIEKNLSYSIESGKDLPEKETAVLINNLVLTPLSSVEGIKKWKNVISLLSGGETMKIDESNIQELLHCAVSLKNKDSIRVVFSKGVEFLKDDIDVLINAVKEYLPEETPQSLIFKADKSPNKVEYLTAVLKAYNVKLKEIEKISKTDSFLISSEDLEQLRVNAYGKKPSKKKGGEEMNKKEGLLAFLKGLFFRKKITDRQIKKEEE